ncbi:DUF2802 domain-containing protein [Paraglaciecola aquimarina]|uniref:DUF2802 domain-containing protein n=1 Tax=Paraglaciecola aquimarina TaxID=1235557 RepID=A0ABU3T089_9ALTE|nr:DUF2802 domain-containing protein [Paraglaciecola aquimarina]MDU0355676.1 DUF2802 domain-containing protein [Paraglaciecola aquimarina]
MDLAIVISLVAVGISCLLVILLIKVIMTNRTQARLLDSQSQQLAIHSQKISNFANELHEVRTGSYATVSRLKDLTSQLEQLRDAQQNIVEQDPQSRFYNKGVKLISQGATVEDVMRECEMPLAEAELLYNLHHNQQ